jgi:hypothetical protein
MRDNSSSSKCSMNINKYYAAGIRRGKFARKKQKNEATSVAVAQGGIVRPLEIMTAPDSERTDRALRHPARAVIFFGFAAAFSSFGSELPFVRKNYHSTLTEWVPVQCTEGSNVRIPLSGARPPGTGADAPPDSRNSQVGSNEGLNAQAETGEPQPHYS